MFHKTQGIVLSTASYSDKYSIVHVFTRDFGRVAYLLSKSNGRKTKVHLALFFPLSLLELETEHLPLREIQRLKEVERSVPLYSLCTDVNKVSIAFFLSEFLSKVLRETSDNALLHDYLYHSVLYLENTERGLGNFHLAFMVGLTRFLGIYPNMDEYTQGAYFDLLNGEFVPHPPLHTYYLSRKQSVYVCYFRKINYRNMHLFKLSRNDRNSIIEIILTYYRLHVVDFPSLKSLDVLREVMG